MKKQLILMPVLLLMAGVALCQSSRDALPLAAIPINYNDMEHQMSADEYARRQASYEAFAVRAANAPASFNTHGIQAAQQGNYEEAIKQFTEAISASRRYADGYYNRGLAELKLYRIAKAAADFSKAVSLSPGNVEYLNQAADAEFASGNMKGAVRDYNSLLGLITTDRNLYLKRGTARGRIKDYKGALADLRKAKQMGSTAADSLMNAISPGSAAQVVLANADKPVN